LERTVGKEQGSATDRMKTDKTHLWGPCADILASGGSRNSHGGKERKKASADGGTGKSGRQETFKKESLFVLGELGRGSL